jgi:hypothetical protein
MGGERGHNFSVYTPGGAGGARGLVGRRNLRAAQEQDAGEDCGTGEYELGRPEFGTSVGCCSDSVHRRGAAEPVSGGGTRHADGNFRCRAASSAASLAGGRFECSTEGNSACGYAGSRKIESTAQEFGLGKSLMSQPRQVPNRPGTNMEAAGASDLTSENPGAASPPDAASNATDLDELERAVDQLSNRAAAVDNSLQPLEQQQAASGFGLRGDMAARHASMKTSFSRARRCSMEMWRERRNI